MNEIIKEISNSFIDEMNEKNPKWYDTTLLYPMKN